MDWDQIKKWRRDQRTALIDRRLGADKALRKAWNASIATYVRSLVGKMPPQTLGFYLPFKGEFDARPLVRELIEQGWTVGLPAVVDKKGPLEFRAWRPGIEMVPGVYDIPVPNDRKVVRPTLLLVPLLGFDSKNYRLGYGGGYYDRTLAALVPRPSTIGIGFELSRLPSIYPQPHDVPIDVVVTEAGIKRR